MQDGNKFYSSREDVELLLRQTLEEPDKPGQKKAKKLTPGKIIRRVLYGLVIASLLFMLGKVWLARINGEVPSLFGYQLYSVETGSMIPTLPIGSTVVVRTLTDADQPAVGDVITYEYESAVITHRITSFVIGNDGVLRYQTQGDNPDNSADPWLVERENIRGIVIWHFSFSLSGS